LWLIDLDPRDYTDRVIDVSEPFEAAEAGGTPIPDGFDID
jgi:hypothetical protein